MVQLLSVALQKGNVDMYCRSELVLSQEQGTRYDAWLGVTVLPAYSLRLARQGVGLPNRYPLFV